MAKSISNKDKQLFLKRALLAADWYVNSQLKLDRVWKGDNFRYLYYYFMPKKLWVPGLNGTHGRALFVLSEAYKLTKDTKYTDSMNIAMRFCKALQPLDPYYQVTYGSIREFIPQSDVGGVLDGAQLASGFLMYHKVTGCPDALRRGRAFCDFMARNWRKDVGLPSFANYFPEKLIYLTPDQPWNCIHNASAIPFWHLYCITGEGKYVPYLLDSADRIIKCQRDDGGIYFGEDITKVKKLEFNHHWGLGDTIEEKCLLRNDDGIVTVVLAAYKVSNDEKYLNAMVRYADWTIKNEPHERPYNAFGIQAANVLDVGKVSGRKYYTEWVMDNVHKHCLKLQALKTGDPMAEGGFRGEDEEGKAGIFGGDALDYVPNRNTCYMAGLLYRLSGKGTGAGFSVFGLG